MIVIDQALGATRVPSICMLRRGGSVGARIWPGNREQRTYRGVWIPRYA